MYFSSKYRKIMNIISTFTSGPFLPNSLTMCRLPSQVFLKFLMFFFSILFPENFNLYCDKIGKLKDIFWTIYCFSTPFTTNLFAVSKRWRRSWFFKFRWRRSWMFLALNLVLKNRVSVINKRLFKKLQFL